MNFKKTKPRTKPEYIGLSAYTHFFGNAVDCALLFRWMTANVFVAHLPHLGDANKIRTLYHGAADLRNITKKSR